MFAKSIYALVLIVFSTIAFSGEALINPQKICSEYGVKDKGDLRQSIDDVSYLNETEVSCIIKPRNAGGISEILRAVNEWNKENKKVHVSVAGSRHSQGGHIASVKGIVLDMTDMATVSSPEYKNGFWTVRAEAGVLWSDVHDVIKNYDGKSLANKVQQSSAPFTVGGTLSVNAHGRSFSYGSVIHSIESVSVVLPDGTLKTASRGENPALFRQVIGGYGLFGVIVDATIELHENHFLKPEIVSFKSPEEYVALLNSALNEYPRYNMKRNDRGAVESLEESSVSFLFATLSLSKQGFLTEGKSYIYKQLPDVDYSGFVNPDPEPGLLNLRAWVTKAGFWLKRKGILVSMAENMQYRFLKSQDTHLKVLTPPIKPILAAAGSDEPDLLQEYFIPVDNMPDFLKHAKKILSESNIQLSNASLRFIPKTDDSSLLTYESETEDQLAIVLYFSLKINNKNIEKAKHWTRDLVDKAISLNGKYYLPYQQWPEKEQFRMAYPDYAEVYDAKRAGDSNEVLSNRFYEHYLKAVIH